MLGIKEAKTAAMALYLQAASMSGFEMSDTSASKLADLVKLFYAKVEAKERPRAVASILKIIASTLEEAHVNNITMLNEGNIEKGKEKVCPLYLND